MAKTLIRSRLELTKEWPNKKKPWQLQNLARWKLVQKDLKSQLDRNTSSDVNTETSFLKLKPVTSLMDQTSKVLSTAPRSSSNLTIEIMKARSQIKKHAKPHGNLLKMLQLVKFNLLFLQLDNDQNKYIIILLKLLSQNFNWTISRDKYD